MKKTYPIFLILILFLSCTKPMIEKGGVHGIVKDATTGEPIAYADVFLLENEKGDGSIIGGGGSSVQIDFTTSDENGNFSFTLEYDKNYSYLCGAEKNLYFDLNQEFIVDGGVETGINVEVALNPYAWLKVHIKSINEYEYSDYISINSLISDAFYGSSIDTAEIISVYGNLTFQMTWFLYEGGIEIFSQTDFIYCSAFDTTFYEILY